MMKNSEKYMCLKDEMFDLKLKLMQEKRILSESEEDHINCRLNEIRTLMKRELIDAMKISKGEMKR